MEESILYVLKREDLYKLFDEDIHIANWGRKFAEFEFLQTEERLISLLFTTASERYKELIENDSDLLQRMPLECLASYLGITPVSLSRIRANIKQRKIE
jgi:CRP-like cAMP-binding protein